VTLETTSSFVDLGLSNELLKAVEEAGYSKPTPIQEKSIPLVLMGRDILGGAQTGTGKTASYALPVIDILASGISKARMPRALILAPTRELAQQIENNFNIYGQQHNLKHVILIGGEAIGDQERALASNPDVIIGTPGRLIDLFERGRLILGGIKFLVIDEADRMLDMGFIPDVEKIVGLLPKIRQTLLFSATLGNEIQSLADKFLINPKEIQVAPSASVATTVEHNMLGVSLKGKQNLLKSLLKNYKIQNAIIFCNRKKDIDALTSSLKRTGFNASALHGDMPQHSRTETLSAFKQGDITYLISSDVAGRGLDINNVSHVFNYDVPIHAEDYVHRIGRTGRAGRKGVAITLVTKEDTKYVESIRQLTGQDLPIKNIKGLEKDSTSAQRIQKSNVVNSNNLKISGEEEVEVIGMGSHIPDFLRDPAT